MKELNYMANTGNYAQNNNYLCNKFNKTLNKLNVLEIIKSIPEVSRAEISRRTGLTKPTVSLIVDELINDRLVYETGVGESSSGRKPTMLNFNSKAYSVIGINFSPGTSLDIAEVDLGGNLLNVISIEQNLFLDPDSVLKIIKDSLKDFFMKEVSNPSNVLGIGVGLPGYIDRSNGLVKVMYNFGWKEVNFSEQLQKTFQLPVFIDNEANALALAESIFGAGRKYNNFIYIDFSSGVGSGIIIEKKLYSGLNNRAGEVGHMIVDKSGPLCRCGKRGCLESHVAPYALKRKVDEILASGNKRGSLPSWADNSFSIAQVVKAAYQDDSMARRILDECCEYLSIAISNLANIFSPEAVILGGDISESDDIVFTALRKYYRDYSLFDEDIDIIPTSLGKYAGVLSSASLVIQDFFSL